MRLHWRRWLLIAVILVGGTILATRFVDLRLLLRTLLRGQWQWLALATILHLGYFVLYAYLYQVGFALVGVRSRTDELLPLVFASYFVNAVAPTGIATAALFVDDAAQRGESGARTAVGMLVVLVADLLTLLPFLAAGLVYLALQDELHPYYVLGAAGIAVFALGMSAALPLARHDPALLRRLLDWTRAAAAAVARRLRRRPPLDEAWVERNLTDLRLASAAIVAHPGRLTWTMAVAFAVHVANLAGLWALFPAYDQPVGFWVLIAGFAMGIIFWVVAIIPQGIGVVEGIMAFVYASLGIPPVKALAISLAFRGLNLWLPVMAGLYFLRHTRSFGGHGRSPLTRRAGPEEDAGPSAPADP